MKLDLTDATFIIPIRIESEDRLRNVITSVAFLLNNFNTNIIIKEVDKTSVFEERALPQLKSFFGDVNLKHIFGDAFGSYPPTTLGILNILYFTL